MSVFVCLHTYCLSSPPENVSSWQAGTLLLCSWANTGTGQAEYLLTGGCEEGGGQVVLLKQESGLKAGVELCAILARVYSGVTCI